VFLVYTIAYDIGFGQAFAAGLVQVALGCSSTISCPHMYP